MLGPCFVIQYFVSFLFCNPLVWEERAVCFCHMAVNVFSCFPYDAVGWFVVCD